MGKYLRRIITLCVTAPRSLPQDNLFHLCEISIRKKGDAGSLVLKDASVQPPDAQRNDVVLVV